MDLSTFTGCAVRPPVAVALTREEGWGLSHNPHIHGCSVAVWSHCSCLWDGSGSVVCLCVCVVGAERFREILVNANHRCLHPFVISLPFTVVCGVFVMVLSRILLPFDTRLLSFGRCSNSILVPNYLPLVQYSSISRGIVCLIFAVDARGSFLPHTLLILLLGLAVPLSLFLPARSMVLAGSHGRRRESACLRVISTGTLLCSVLRLQALQMVLGTCLLVSHLVSAA